MSKRIFILITKAEVGGAQMSVLNLAKGLTEKGIEVRLGFGEGNFLPQELAGQGIGHTRFKYLKRTHNPLASLFFIWEIKKYFDKNSFSTVHINSSNALLASLGAKLSRSRPRVVFTFRGMSILDENYKKNRFLRVFYKLYFKFFLKFVDEPVFVSQHNLELARQLGLAKRENLIYNGLKKSELDFYTDQQSLSELSSILSKKTLAPGKGGSQLVRDNDFLIGSIGRLAYQKNYEFLISVFPRILEIGPNAKLVVIGEGPEGDNYRAKVKQAGLEESIFFPGGIDRAFRYLKTFDLFVLPSRYEGLSITLIEALFAGVPVLASQVGGASEMLNPEQLYSLDDKEEFLEKFRNIFGARGFREELSQRNRIKSEEFDIEKTVQSYLSLYS